MMKRIDRIIRTAAAMLLAGALLASCSDKGEEGPEYLSDTIRVNTLAVGSSRVPKTDVDDHTFMVLFWRDPAHLEFDPAAGAGAWSSASAEPILYLAGQAPQPVAFYERSVYDLRYPYPDSELTELYATGYSPGSMLGPKDGHDYRTLEVDEELLGTGKSEGNTSNPIHAHLGRYDYMGCDVWREVYFGSRADPFAQDRNRLYYRHLAAKLLVFADRDKESMENKQFVRDVRVTNLFMSIDGGQNWLPMYTPSAFEWQELVPSDFTAAYNKTIAAVKALPANGSVPADSRPKAGYKTVKAAPFAGSLDPAFTLQRKTYGDRVPIYGMFIDSCFVCNPFNNETGAVQANKPIQLKMDITALLSYDPNFPDAPDAPNDAAGGSTGVDVGGGDTSGDGEGNGNLTFWRTWREMKITSIKELDPATGEETGASETVFEPGCEYRIYIHFYRTGVDLVARKLPWDSGGSHYIPIPGGDGSDQGGEAGGGNTGGETGGGDIGGTTDPGSGAGGGTGTDSGTDPGTDQASGRNK